MKTELAKSKSRLSISSRIQALQKLSDLPSALRNFFNSNRYHNEGDEETRCFSDYFSTLWILLSVEGQRKEIMHDIVITGLGEMFPVMTVWRDRGGRVT